MRVAADQRGLEHRCRKEIDRILREVAAKERALARTEARERHALVRDLARPWSEKARECRDERRLAGAVRPDDRPAFPCANVEIELRDERARTDCKLESAARETRSVAFHVRARDSNARNIGTPTSAVITPTGS